jgi:hypothetical protein
MSLSVFFAALPSISRARFRLALLVLGVPLRSPFLVVVLLASDVHHPLFLA